MKMLNRLLVTVALSPVSFHFQAFAQAPLTAYANFEGAQTNPIRLSADGTRLYAVNTPDARLSVFDITQPSSPVLIAEIPVGIEPVSVNPRTNDEVWVVNQESDSVSIVSVSKGIVTDTIHVKDEPMDVVFAGPRAFVSVSRNNLVAVFNVVNHQGLSAIPLQGGNPRALALSPDKSKVYAAFALSGNGTTVVPFKKAPPQPPPTNSQLPPPPGAGLIIKATDPAWTSLIKYTMPDYDVAVIDAATMAVTSYYSGVGTLNLGIAVRPTNGDIFVSNTDARNLTFFEPNLKGHFVDNRITRIQTDGTVTAFDLNPGIDYTVLPNPDALSKALAQPTAVVFDPNGLFMYIAAFGTDRVAKVDANGRVLERIEIGNATGSSVDPAHKRGPRGLALNAATERLYVLNRISNTLSVVNTAAKAVVAEIPVGAFDPTPTVIRAGRGFLYDAKLSGNGTAACAACHLDADMDMLAWNLGDPGGEMQTVVQLGDSFSMHPMKGPMTTQTLRGLKGLAPYHWRGDRADFAAFNPAFVSLMGGSPISDADMAAYSAYIDTLVFQPNPFQNLDRSLPSAILPVRGNPINGRNVFLSMPSNFANQPCADCHTIPGAGTDLRLRPNFFDQNMKSPHLRNIYQKTLLSQTDGAQSIGGFGLSNDGEFDTPFNFLSSVFIKLFRERTAKQDLSAFMMCFDTGTAPAVGFTLTMTAVNVSNALVTQQWNTLQSQAFAGNIDLIAKGMLDGQRHGLLFQPGSGTYVPDAAGLGPFTQAEMTAMIQSGGTLSVMGVPPGSGARMGIDRNLNGVLDADEPGAAVR